MLVDVSLLNLGNFQCANICSTVARSPYPNPTAGPPILRPPSAADRDRERRITRPPQFNAPPSPPVHLSDLDPDNVSRELRKEGSDWQAMWSS